LSALGRAGCSPRLPLRLTLRSSPQRPHLNGRACRSRRCNGGAPRPPCLHNGLGAPPLFRLAPQSSAVVSGTSRGLGLGRFPQPEAANRIRLSHPTGSVARTPCDRELLPREVRSYQLAARVDTTVERRDHHVCTMVSALHR